MNHKILVIDDDLSILRLLKNVLELENYQVDIRSNVIDVDYCDFMDYDLIILDIMMPVSGIEICKSIREYIKSPIIFITAKNMDKDLIEGIQAGADDYITKPFNIEVLLAKVKMHLRREDRKNTTDKLLIFDGVTINVGRKEVIVDNSKLPLTKREFDIVHILASEQGRVHNIEELYERLYPQSSEAQWHTISEFIYQIRLKFKPFNINPIKTIWGGGYKWLFQEVLSN